MASFSEKTAELGNISGSFLEKVQAAGHLQTTIHGAPSASGLQFSLVNTTDAVSDAVNVLEGLPVAPPSLYVDLEGVDLSRHGTISILQIYVLPLRKTYLIDIFELRERAFNTTTVGGNTLKRILESASIPKVFFDVRNDSDALYSHYGINLAGVQDLQLMEFVTRGFRGRYVCGLAKCIEKDAPLTVAERNTWKAIKEKGLQLFAPERGGSYEVFNQRPLSQEILSYCLSDVEFLPRLWSLYNGRMNAELKNKVNRGAEERVALSQSPSYNGKGQHKALPPPGW